MLVFYILHTYLYYYIFLEKNQEGSGFFVSRSDTKMRRRETNDKSGGHPKECPPLSHSSPKLTDSALSTLCMASLSSSPMRSLRRFLSNVRTCSSRTIESFASP